MPPPNNIYLAVTSLGLQQVPPAAEAGVGTFVGGGEDKKCGETLLAAGKHWTPRPCDVAV